MATKSKPLPICKVFLPCLQVTEDQLGALSVHGVLKKFVSHEEPAIQPRIDFFIQLSGGVGQYGASVAIVDLSTDKSLAVSPKFPCGFDDRAERAFGSITCRRITFPHFGAYEFVLFIDDQEVERYRVSLVHPSDLKPTKKDK